MLRKITLVFDIFVFIAKTAYQRLHFSLDKKKAARCAATLQAATGTESKNIILIGVSFGGVAILGDLASALPRHGDWNLIAIEPRSHFHFTWALPRFRVEENHVDKAFIPYGGLLKRAGERCRIINSRVTQISKQAVVLADGSEIDYAYLIISTGTTSGSGLPPSQVGADNKEEGVLNLRNIQAKTRRAKNIVVVGGGAAGVEFATDAKSKYPEKSVVLVHSRPSVLHRFGPKLQSTAMKAMRDLEIRVILQDRVVSENAVDGKVVLKSEEVLECDHLVSVANSEPPSISPESKGWQHLHRTNYKVNCTGQTPNSQLLMGLSPNSINAKGYIRVKPTMQVADDTLPNVYAVGDVADAGIINTNGRMATFQGMIAASNILLQLIGEDPRYVLGSPWILESIKLTLGGVSDFFIPIGGLTLTSAEPYSRYTEFWRYTMGQQR